MSKGGRMLALTPHCPAALSRKADWALGHFVMVKKLGVGGASEVYKAFPKGSDAPLAVKLYFKSKMTALNVHQVHREIMIHAQLDHPNIIALVRSALPARKAAAYVHRSLLLRGRPDPGSCYEYMRCLTRLRRRAVRRV